MAMGDREMIDYADHQIDRMVGALMGTEKINIFSLAKTIQRKPESLDSEENELVISILLATALKRLVSVYRELGRAQS